MYAEARRLAHSLDGTRATTGAMAAPSPSQALAGWAEDLFAYDDYGSTHFGAVDANAQISPPVPNLPYLVSEAVGALTGPPNYRWMDTSTLQEQTKLHAQVNQQARSNPAYAGVLAWAGIDYGSLTGGNRVWNNLPAFPPVVGDLTVDGSSQPTLTVVGYYQGRQVATLQMSPNAATDRLAIDLEDKRIVGDGSDTARLSFRATDAFGNQRPYVTANVSISLHGPAAIVGQNPFAFGQFGGVGGAIIRSEAGRSGTALVTVSHPTLGSAQATLTVTTAAGKHL